MCVVSNVGDYYQTTIPRRYPNWFPEPQPVEPVTPTPGSLGAMPVVPAGVSQEEFNRLKAEVERMKDLLVKAKEIDDATDQPHCETESKVAILKQLAKLFNISLEDVFGK